MQCIEFQKNYSADSTSVSQRLIEHKNNCPECQRFVDEVSEIDDRLKQAFRIGVPGYLAGNLLEIPEKQNRKTYYSGFVKLAMAATVILVVGLASLQLSSPLDESHPTEFVYEHIIHEP